MAHQSMRKVPQKKIRKFLRRRRKKKAAPKLKWGQYPKKKAAKEEARGERAADGYNSHVSATTIKVIARGRVIMPAV